MDSALGDDLPDRWRGLVLNGLHPVFQAKHSRAVILCVEIPLLQDVLRRRPKIPVFVLVEHEDLILPALGGRSEGALQHQGNVVLTASIGSNFRHTKSSHRG
jgi:hypothetical protein